MAMFSWTKVISTGAKVLFRKDPIGLHIIIQDIDAYLYPEEINQHCLIVLIACCAEAKYPAACRALSDSLREGCCVNSYTVANCLRWKKFCGCRTNAGKLSRLDGGLAWSRPTAQAISLKLQLTILLASHFPPTTFHSK